MTAVRRVSLAFGVGGPGLTGPITICRSRADLLAYPAKLDGVSGHIILEPRNEILQSPQISFVPVSGKKETFIRPLDDIIEIKKVRSAVAVHIP
jgi:hypothetical protein